jgi:hypothetical protein
MVKVGDGFGHLLWWVCTAPGLNQFSALADQFSKNDWGF